MHSSVTTHIDDIDFGHVISRLSHTIRSIFGTVIFDDMCTIILTSLAVDSVRSWFNVHQSIFDEDMHEKRYLHFRFQWLSLLIFRPQICSTSYSCPALCFHEIKSLWLYYFEKIGGTRRTDGVQHLMRPHREGRITICSEVNCAVAVKRVVFLEIWRHTVSQN